MREARFSVSYPTHFPTFACPSSLELVESCTRILLPHSWRLDMSSLILVSDSNGVESSSALVDVWFLSHTVCIKASPQRYLGSCVLWSIAWTFSRSVRFRHSAMPLS